MRPQRLTMTVEEASEALGISRSLAYELVRRGEIPSLRLGRRIVVPVHALDNLVERTGVVAPS
jgi:excisionase family DNA binding protein